MRDHFKFVEMRLRVVKKRDEGAQQGDNMTVRFCRLSGKYALSIISRAARPRSLQAERWTCSKGKVGKPGPGGSGGEGRENRKIFVQEYW